MTFVDQKNSTNTIIKMGIKDLIDELQTDWKDILLSYPNLDKIQEFLEKEKRVYGTDLPTHPSVENIFRCFNYVNSKKIKVVILGQDPYHGPNQAIGLCFGINKGMKIPPSLKNIQKEIKNDINLVLEDLSLEKWAKQGVLLLNTSLTVREKNPASHMNIWLPFTKYIIEYLNKHNEGIAFVAWGAFAHNKLQNININKHYLLVSSHPSPFSANRCYRAFPAFIGSNPFSKINTLIKDCIHW